MSARPVYTGETAFEDHGIAVDVEYRYGRPFVALLIHGETSWLCPEDARFLADHLPDKLRRAAAEVEAARA